MSLTVKDLKKLQEQFPAIVTVPGLLPGWEVWIEDLWCLEFEEE